MYISEDFFLKNRLAVVKIARFMFVAEVKNKIPTITEFSEQFNISRGTIQKAIMYLWKKEGIDIKKRGHQGTILLKKNQAILWRYTGWRSITGVMPLPLNLLVGGLATGICDCMKQHNINFNCVFLQSSETRVSALLHHNYDFIIASGLTAHVLDNKYEQMEKVMELSNVAYSGCYRLMLTKGKTKLEDGMTIAVDPTSIDQNYLTNLLEKHLKLNRKETTYIDSYKSVVKGTADVVVSRQDVMEVEYPEQYYMDLPEFASNGEDIAEYQKVVIFSKRDNYNMPQLLNKVLDAKTIANVQQDVIHKKRSPQYY